MTRPAYLLDHEDLCPVCPGAKLADEAGADRPAGGEVALGEEERGAHRFSPNGSGGWTKEIRLTRM